MIPPRLRISLNIAITVLVTAALGLVPSNFAFADDGPVRIPKATPLIGSSIQPSGGIPGKGAPNPVFLAAKEQMAREYAAMRTGKISFDTYSADQRAFEARWYGPSPAASRNTPTSRNSASAAGPDSCCFSNDLSVAQYPQSQTYYCGPGATQSTLAYLGYFTSYDGEALSQACMAGACGPGAPKSQKYLETDLWGNTPWYVSQTDWPVPGTLNYWRTGAYTGFYVGQFPPDEPTYEWRLAYDVDNGWPSMPDVHEWPGSTHLWGHPDVEIFHWITAFGYSSYGAQTDYVDPAANSVVGWPNVQPTNYGYGSSDMYYLLSNHGQTFGLVW